jgi:hypothetical protein
MADAPHIKPMPEYIRKQRAAKVEQAFKLLREVGAVIDVIGSGNRSKIIVDETEVTSNEDGTVSIKMDGVEISHHVGVANVSFTHGKFHTITLALIPKMMKLNKPV